MFKMRFYLEACKKCSNVDSPTPPTSKHVKYLIISGEYDPRIHKIDNVQMC